MSEKSLKIGFMGTPDFALVALKKIVEAGHNVACVYSQPPRPKGRGHQVQKSPVHEYADEQGIPVFTPKSLKSDEAKSEFASHNLDVAIVAAYGLILPEDILKAPQYGCLNIHGSILPRWRGAAPIQYAIWKGDEETGVTIMQMDKGLDTGPMIAKKEVSITDDTTASYLHDELAEIGGQMTLEVLSKLAKNGHLESEEQDDKYSTYASMLKKEDGIINWSQSAAEIDRQIRALNPWPGVWTSMNAKRIKILKASVEDKSETNYPQNPGTFINNSGHVTCGNDSVLVLEQVQPEGKKPMDVKSAINGGYLKPGEIFK